MRTLALVAILGLTVPVSAAAQPDRSGLAVRWHAEPGGRVSFPPSYEPIVVYFGGVRAPVVREARGGRAADGPFGTTVLAPRRPGRYVVTIVAGGARRREGLLEVALAPRVTEIVPARATPGSLVTLRGSRLLPSDRVQLIGIGASVEPRVVRRTSTAIVIELPYAEAPIGPVSVSLVRGSGGAFVGRLDVEVPPAEAREIRAPRAVAPGGEIALTLRSPLPPGVEVLLGDRALVVARTEPPSLVVVAPAERLCDRIVVHAGRAILHALEVTCVLAPIEDASSPLPPTYVRSILANERVWLPVRNAGAAPSIRIGDRPVPVDSVSDAAVSLLVPHDLAPGRHDVFVSNGISEVRVPYPFEMQPRPR